MHMTDALLSPAVGGVMTAISAAAAARAVNRAGRAEDYDRAVPMMGVLGAFVFAAQMINVAIPGTGASGHIGGGVLLAALLGPYRALLTMAAILLLQCLFFADGGLLAYGCNLFNLGVCACWLAYTLAYRPIMKRGLNKRNIILASMAASVLGLQAGAFGVVLETTLSGVAGLPFGLFAALMQPIHLAVGLLEGAVTAAVLCFLYQARPSLLTHDAEKAPASGKRLWLAALAATLLIGGVFSLFASQQPDGLEWSMEKAAGIEAAQEAPVSATHEMAGKIVETTALMPDYDIPIAAGITGSLAALALTAGAGYLLRRRAGKKTVSSSAR